MTFTRKVHVFFLIAFICLHCVRLSTVLQFNYWSKIVALYIMKNPAEVGHTS